MILAQAQSEDIANAIKQFGEAAEKMGSAKAAELAPTHWILACVCIVAIAVFCVVVWMFTRESKENRSHIRGLFESMIEGNKASAQECHRHGQNMSDRSERHVNSLTEAVHELKDCTADLKDMTSDTKQLVKSALAKIDGPK